MSGVGCQNKFDGSNFLTAIFLTNYSYYFGIKNALELGRQFAKLALGNNYCFAPQFFFFFFYKYQQIRNEGEK